jgi:hypothetical protein
MESKGTSAFRDALSLADDLIEKLCEVGISVDVFELRKKRALHHRDALKQFAVGKFAVKANYVCVGGFDARIGELDEDLDCLEKRMTKLRQLCEQKQSGKNMVG